MITRNEIIQERMRVELYHQKSGSIYGFDEFSRIWAKPDINGSEWQYVTWELPAHVKSAFGRLGIRI